MTDDNTPATKGDIREFVTKKELDNALTSFATDIKKHFDEKTEETKRHFDVVAEQIHKEMESANGEEIEVMKDNIKILKKTVGIA